MPPQPTDPAPAPAHSQVLDALVRNDAEVLDRLVADDCRIVGPKGFLIGKQERIEAHPPRRPAALRVPFQGETIKGSFRVLNGWSRAGDVWQLVGIHYTAVAPEAAGTAP